MKYKVLHYIDDVYEVWSIEDDVQVFSGRLADCEAWIRLNESGYI